MAEYLLARVHDPEISAWMVSVAPTAEPVTLAEAKAACRISSTDEDALITTMIKAAREHVENATNRALVTQTRVLKLDRFPPASDQVIELPGGIIQSVTSITYVDSDGNTQTWGASNYVLDSTSEPGTVGVAYGTEWPDERDWGMAVTITYVAGWPGSGSPVDLAANVPEAIKTAIKMIVAHWDMNRETASSSAFAEIPFGASALLSPYRLKRRFA